LPVVITDYGFVPDSGGAGKYRGGLAMRRTYALRASGASLGLRSDRRVHRPAGLHGGLDGSPSFNLLTREGESTLLPSMPSAVIALERDDQVCHIAAGGAGYGSPWERDPHAVREDLLDGLMSETMARDLYGVVIDHARGEIDPVATEAARAALAQLPADALRARQERIFAESNGLQDAVCSPAGEVRT
jgi:N-methylhydantoinase B